MIDFEALVKKSARQDGFRFLNLSDVKWKGLTDSFSEPVARRASVAVPTVFAEDPFVQMADFSGQVREQIIAPGRQEHLFERNQVTGAAAFESTLHLYRISENASLELVYFQSGDAQIFSRLHFTLAKNARLRLTVIQRGISKGQVRVAAECMGEGADAQIHGLTVGEAAQRQDFWADVYHHVPHTQSNMVAWCAVKDQAHSVFNGTITIDQKAPFTEAFQKNKNLILSDRATVDTFPKLFIANNEVKAAHGSSVSTLEPDQLIYLQSRGIDRAQAEQMLVRGFIRQAVEWIENADTRTELECELLGEVEE